MKKTILCALAGIAFQASIISDSFAQSNATNKAGKTDFVKSAGKQAEPGTYQFIVSQPDPEEAFTNDILVIIENMRDEKHDKIIALSNHTKVKIPSRAEISRADFKPLKETVYVSVPQKPNQSK
ncbi:MAG: hypothetical protein DWQ44_04635 [Bacteroidetes bacterium]|nr:MAG: hypothetical protein DWQ33_11155 [Bacteroidota bacterium]REK00644.1 MAG: hypothetical protein DWQ39_10830 [Bacteroidota bacterium]REK35234.1 MAG: hypothetical protein DWQ44_04635 [Bacteroidota bacterium]REK48311.1 MAG: hypothetical protein DWQ48_10835 [Bacteroidota bacterium]